MDYMIGNAWCDENGKSSGGQPGDQTQKIVCDYKGEVRQQPFYENKKGWFVIRWKDEKLAIKACEKMMKACDNANIGYSQSDRESIYKCKTTSKKPTNCDCSSLVCQIVREVTGKKIPDFYTATEPDVLAKTGYFEDKVVYKTGMKLCHGDILVTCVKGHTAIITSGYAFDKVKEEVKKAEKTIDELAKEVIDGKWGNGEDRKKRLEAAGYTYYKVQERVNQILLVNPKKYYRVQTPYFKTVSAMDKAMALAKRYGYEFFVINDGGNYKIQLGAFSVRKNADMFTIELGEKGIKTEIHYY